MVVVAAPRFTRRLLELTRGGGAGNTRRQDDRQILLKSASLMIPDGEQPETEVNTCLLRWVAVTGLRTDYVTWRRYLVDAGWLVRDRARSWYRKANPDPAVTGVTFEPEVDALDIPAVFQVARAAEGERKRAWRGDAADR